jgi:hypothetical protein
VLTDSPTARLFSAVWQMVLILAPLGPLFAQSTATLLGGIGPGLSNTDFSISKNTKISKTISVQFRAEFFDLFNHANLVQPGNVVASPIFGVITNTTSQQVNPVRHGRCSSL